MPYRSKGRGDRGFRFIQRTEKPAVYGTFQSAKTKNTTLATGNTKYGRGNFEKHLWRKRDRRWVGKRKKQRIA